MVHDEMGLINPDTDIRLSLNIAFADCPICWQNFILHLQSTANEWKSVETVEVHIVTALAKFNAQRIGEIIRFKTSKDKFFFILKWSAS